LCTKNNFLYQTKSGPSFFKFDFFFVSARAVAFLFLRDCSTHFFEMFWLFLFLIFFLKTGGKTNSKQKTNKRQKKLRYPLQKNVARGYFSLEQGERVNFFFSNYLKKSKKAI